MTDHFQLAVEFFNQGEFEKACEEYEQAIVLQWNNLGAYIGWGNALYNLKEYEDAITKYQKAIDLSPNYSEAYYSWGNALGLLQRYEDAM
jgi:tetratricopeptide (TPR) repeat protein